MTQQERKHLREERLQRSMATAYLATSCFLQLGAIGIMATSQKSLHAVGCLLLSYLSLWGFVSIAKKFAQWKR